MVVAPRPVMIQRGSSSKKFGDQTLSSILFSRIIWSTSSDFDKLFVYQKTDEATCVAKGIFMQWHLATNAVMTRLLPRRRKYAARVKFTTSGGTLVVVTQWWKSRNHTVAGMKSSRGRPIQHGVVAKAVVKEGYCGYVSTLYWVWILLSRISLSN